MKDQIRGWLDSIRRGFKLAPEDPLDTWVELIHHAAIYSDFLNVVPEPDEVVRFEMVSRLRVTKCPLKLTVLGPAAKESMWHVDCSEVKVGA